MATGKQRVLQRYMQKVATINGLEEAMQALPDEELSAKTTIFRSRLQKGERLDDVLPEAFAVVREASRRVLNMRHYDVQLIGGMVLHEGAIAEMQTGEGKTLVATLAAYLNALEGKGVHIVTVNDYLAKRDCEWMGKLYRFLGISVAVVQEGQSQSRKRAAFNADITYLTANSLGFTFLGDTSAVEKKEDLAILRPFHYAIVDEADSLLIDDCRNPLIISAEPDNTSNERFLLAHKVINCKVQGGKPFLWEQEMEPETGRVLLRGHYVVDRKLHRISLTREGMIRVLALLVELGEQFPEAQAEGRAPTINDLWESADPMGPYIITALRARELHRRDVNYIVRDGEVKIVNPSTGRVMPTSRWTDDLHQAIEAQEYPEVEIKGRTKISSSITFQTLFKYYTKLSGMTGTAVTEEEEFHEVYGLDVTVVPTHKPRKRIDHEPRVFLTEDDMLRALGLLLKKARSQLRPVLIGTASVADSEYAAANLNRWGIHHQMLNARPKYIQREAKVIAQAGVPGSITIATNMAGRGTDIILGGNPKGLAHMALQDTLLPSMLSVQDEVDLQWDEMPEIFDYFRTPEERRYELPPELAGALERTQAVVSTMYDKDKLPSHKADQLITDALEEAEVLHQQLIALLDARQRSAPVFEELFPRLKSLVDAKLGAHDTSEGPDVSAELTRVLAYLWLYFDEECAYRAAEVKAVGGLLVLVLSMQESERVANQLKGRAGRQGDPGETFTLVDLNDPLVESSGLTGGLDAIRPMLQRMEPDLGFLPDPASGMYISMVHNALREGKRASRYALLQSDAILEVFRRHKSELRMQLLAGSAAQRARLLRGAFMDAAEWLVRANVDARHSPSDALWDLKKLVHQVRYMVNPGSIAKLKIETPRTPQAAQLWRSVTKLNEYPIPTGDAENVMGPLSDKDTAEKLRRALMSGKRAAALFEAVPLDLPSNLQEEMRLHMHSQLQKERAILEGAGFKGRWAWAAEALAEYVGQALMAAYELSKRSKIADAFTEYLELWRGALARGDLDANLQEPGTLAENVEAYEREVMIRVLDRMWAEFLEDMKSVDTAVHLRSFSHLNALDELRLEGSDLFLKSLKRLRQQWATDIMRGPFLPVDLDVILEQQAPLRLGPPPLDLDIGPPISDLSEGMDEPTPSSSASANEPREAEVQSFAAASEAAADCSNSEKAELHSSAANGKPSQPWEETVSAGDGDLARLGMQNGAAEAESAAVGADHVKPESLLSAS
ncbi:Protein translocase subunit SecA [Coccomyxa sp. Obi]|nr:Protein translocase subunit SecA [Coccomyxa sp. Obi]